MQPVRTANHGSALIPSITLVEITIHLQGRLEEGGTLRKIHVPDGVERFMHSVSPEERTAANASRV